MNCSVIDYVKGPEGRTRTPRKSDSIIHHNRRDHSPIRTTDRGNTYSSGFIILLLSPRSFRTTVSGWGWSGSDRDPLAISPSFRDSVLTRYPSARISRWVHNGRGSVDHEKVGKDWLLKIKMLLERRVRFMCIGHRNSVQPWVYPGWSILE